MASDGGGISGAAALTLNNSIVAGNAGGDISGTVVGQSNLIGDASGGLNPSKNLVGAGNPGLGPLQDNGGPTYTMALLPGSPAINRGDFSLLPGGFTTDQRGPGFPRVVGSTVDIGAFEAGTPAAIVAAVASPNADATDGAGAVIVVTVQFSQPVLVTGTPAVLLNSGGVPTFTSGSGTAALSFTYAVTVGENSAHLDYAATDALQLSGGTIRDEMASTST